MSVHGRRLSPGLNVLIALGVLALYQLLTVHHLPLISLFPGIAEAQHSGGSHGGGGGTTEDGHSNDEHEDGGHEDGGHGDPGSIWLAPRGHGQGSISSGPGHSRSDYGGRSGRNSVEEVILRRPGAGAMGGGSRPTWAGGAVPEDIELGRLNMARAPQSVRQRALAEAYASLLDMDQDGQIDPTADLSALESPMANLALYEQAISERTLSLSEAALFLGKSAEKKLPITTETVFALHTILDLEDPEIVFVDFEYDRATSFEPDVIASVFGGQTATGFGAAGFALAADDVRAVQQFGHDHDEEDLVN